LSYYDPSSKHPRAKGKGSFGILGANQDIFGGEDFRRVIVWPPLVVGVAVVLFR